MKQQQEIDRFFKANGWPYWSSPEIVCRLAEEVGEVARAVSHIDGPKKRNAKEGDHSLGAEIGDVIYTLACLANKHGIDLDREFEASIARSHKKDCRA